MRRDRSGGNRRATTGGQLPELFERVERAMGRGGLRTNYRKGTESLSEQLAIGREDLAWATRSSRGAIYT